MSAFWLSYITDRGNLGVAHALYHVTLSRVCPKQPLVWNFWSLFAYLPCHFYASAITIKKCFQGSIPIVKRLLGENRTFLSPVKHGPQNGANSEKYGLEIRFYASGPKGTSLRETGCFGVFCVKICPWALAVASCKQCLLT